MLIWKFFYNYKGLKIKHQGFKRKKIWVGYCDLVTLEWSHFGHTKNYETSYRVWYDSAESPWNILLSIWVKKECKHFTFFSFGTS